MTDRSAHAGTCQHICRSAYHGPVRISRRQSAYHGGFGGAVRSRRRACRTGGHRNKATAPWQRKTGPRRPPDWSCGCCGRCATSRSWRCCRSRSADETAVLPSPTTAVAMFLYHPPSGGLNAPNSKGNVTFATLVEYRQVGRLVALRQQRASLAGAGPRSIRQCWARLLPIR